MIWTLKTDKLLFCWHLKWRLKNVFLMVRVSPRPFWDFFETQFPHKMHFFHPTWTLKQPQILFMFKVKYVDSIMMVVKLDLNLIVLLFQHKCEVSETVSTTTLENTIEIFVYRVWAQLRNGVPSSIISRRNWRTVPTQQCTTTTSLLQKQNWKTWVRKFSVCKRLKGSNE